MGLAANRAEAHGAKAGASQRVFFALWPNAPTSASLTALTERVASQAGGRATPPERLHLTLAFVGNVDPARLAILAQIGAQAAAATPPFRLIFDRLGGFREAEVAWLGVSPVPAALADLVRRLAAELDHAGFAVDRRPYRAHLTLARRCQRAARTGTVEPPLLWEVDAITLTASTLTPQGPSYENLWRWSLAGASSDVR